LKTHLLISSREEILLLVFTFKAVALSLQIQKVVPSNGGRWTPASPPDSTREGGVGLEIASPDKVGIAMTVREDFGFYLRRAGKSRMTTKKIEFYLFPQSFYLKLY
jgi:hypothetical protein